MCISYVNVCVFYGFLCVDFKLSICFFSRFFYPKYKVNNPCLYRISYVEFFLRFGFGEKLMYYFNLAKYNLKASL